MPLSYSYGVVVERIGISDSIDATLAYNDAEVVMNLSRIRFVTFRDPF